MERVLHIFFFSVSYLGLISVTGVFKKEKKKKLLYSSSCFQMNGSDFLLILAGQEVTV